MDNSSPWISSQKAAIYKTDSMEIKSETYSTRIKYLQLKNQVPAAEKSETCSLNIVKLQVILNQMASDEILMTAEKNLLSLKFLK